MATQAALVTVIQKEAERMHLYLAALPQDAWTKPSACALWEIRDVAAHLTVPPQAYTLRITRGLQGDTSSPGSAPAPHLWKTHTQEERRQRWMQMGQGPFAHRGWSRNDLVSGFRQAWEPFPPFLATLTAHDWHKPCYHSFGIVPVHSLAHAGLFELAIHGWDIRSALAPSAPLSPDVLPAILDFFAECPHWFLLPAARLSTPIRYRFVFTGALSGQWDVVVEGDQAHIGPAADATPANVTFACEMETFALLICRRIGFDAALGDKRLIPTGDMAVAQEFKQWFQGV